MEKEPRVIAQEIVDDVLDYFREELDDMKKIYPYLSEVDSAIVRAWAFTFFKEKVVDYYEGLKNVINNMYKETRGEKEGNDNS